MERIKIDKKYIAVLIVAVFVTWTLHELAHWIVGEYLNYDMGMSLNKTFPIQQQYKNDHDPLLISAAGPVFTLLEALFVFILMMSRGKPVLYPFLFTCFYMRLFATIISLRNPNDEARVSDALGLGKFALPLAMTAILLILIRKVSSSYKFDSRFNLVNLGLVMLFSSILILADQYFQLRIL